MACEVHCCMWEVYFPRPTKGLNQLIQFYSNNATNLHHLSIHSTTVLPHKMAIVLRPQICDVISPYV